MKKHFENIFIVAILLLIQIVGAVAGAEKINPLELPKFNYFVNDFSYVLGQEQKALDQRAKNIQNTQGSQIVTVLFPHREGNELFDIALKAFNENGIGDKEKNDGILLAIATQEKKIRIIVGYGLEHKIPDLLASKIIEEHIRPEIEKNNFPQAVANFYTQIEDILSTNAQYTKEKEKNINVSDSNLVRVIIGFFLLTGIIDFVRKGKSKIGKEKILGGILTPVGLGLAFTPYSDIGIFILIFGIMLLTGSGGPRRGGFGRGGFGGFGGFGGGFGRGGFSGGGGSSGGGGAGD